MKDANTTKTMPKRTKSSKTDWSRFDAMTETRRHQAALNDPDARPLTEEDLAGARVRDAEKEMALVLIRRGQLLSNSLEFVRR